MTATTINTKTTPTAEAIQEALAFLRNLSEKNDPESAEKTESLFNSDILKTIEAALKSSTETKAKTAPVEDEEDDGEEDVECAGDVESEEEDDDDDDDDDDNADEDDEEDNPFAGTYYWNPGPEWKTIGLIAGDAALVGLGALLYKLFDD